MTMYAKRGEGIFIQVSASPLREAWNTGMAIYLFAPLMVSHFLIFCIHLDFFLSRSLLSSL